MRRDLPVKSDLAVSARVGAAVAGGADDLMAGRRYTASAVVCRHSVQTLSNAESVFLGCAIADDLRCTKLA